MSIAFDAGEQRTFASCICGEWVRSEAFAEATSGASIRVHFERLFNEHLASVHDVPLSKKELILKLYEEGEHDIARIVQRVKARPSYVAQVLQQAGLLTGYLDLYTTTARETNIYSRFFRNVLSLKDEDAAREAVRKLDRLYNYFERLGDRAGQHQSLVMALTGRNRARWSGKHEVSQIYKEWMDSH